jgi:hypothetical protein
MSIQRDSIWAQVKPDDWKWKPRTRRITGVLIHTTRGGQWYDGNTELGAYINWCRSDNNFVPFPGGNYAGIANYGTGPNRIVECVPARDYMATWSSWPSDETKVSIEVAQSNLGQPIETETIAATVHLVRELQAEHKFPLTRVYPVNDWTWSGMAGHEDTVQGKAQGKSDPGAAFWEPFMAALEGDAMTPEEKARLERVERLLAARGTVPVTVTAGNIDAVHMVRPGAVVGEIIELSGDDTLAYLDYQGNNFWAGLAATQNRVYALEQNSETPEYPRVITITGATIKGALE